MDMIWILIKALVEANLKWAISKNRIVTGGFIGFEKNKVSN